jgi:hypothetical protein
VHAHLTLYNSVDRGVTQVQRLAVTAFSGTFLADVVQSMTDSSDELDCRARRRRPAATGKADTAKMDNEILKIRVSQGMVEALEEYLETLRTQAPFIHMSRAEAIRWLIALGLERDRAEQAQRQIDAEQKRALRPPLEGPGSGR